jgi:hypothetical protein
LLEKHAPASRKCPRSGHLPSIYNGKIESKIRFRPAECM